MQVQILLLFLLLLPILRLVLLLQLHHLQFCVLLLIIISLSSKTFYLLTIFRKCIVIICFLSKMWRSIIVYNRK